MKQILSSKIHLTKTDKEGAFPCPLYRNSISLDQNSGKDYSILEAKVSDSGLEEVVIFCKKCESQINLICFPRDDWLS